VIWSDWCISWFCRLAMSSRRKRRSCKRRFLKRWKGPRSLQSRETNKQQCSAWRGKSTMKAKWTRLEAFSYALIPRREWSLTTRGTNNTKWEHISGTMYRTQLCSVQICNFVRCQPLVCSLSHSTLHLHFRPDFLFPRHDNTYFLACCTVYISVSHTCFSSTFSLYSTE